MNAIECFWKTWMLEDLFGNIVKKKKEWLKNTRNEQSHFAEQLLYALK